MYPRVGTCIPAGPFMVSRTAFCIQCLSIFSASRGVREMPMIMEGADPAQARNDMAEKVIAHGAEWLLFIDSDMEFPPNALMRLMAHDVDIVGVDYRRRGQPFSPIGAFDPETMPQGEHGLLERQYLGLGLLLVRKDVFAKIPKPWFARVYEPNAFMTEDIYFAYKAKQAGFKVWCDIDLTRQVNHMGTMPVPWDIPNHPVAPT